MKYLLIALFAIPAAFAQQFRGEAVYQTKQIINLTSYDENGNVIENDPIIEKLKKSYEKEYILYFDKSASLYVEQPKLDDPVPGRPAVSSDIPLHSKFYKDIKDKTYVREKELMSKEFLEMDSLEIFDWKLENETKKIGSYTCYKATYIIPRKPKDPNAEPKAINILGNDKEPQDIVMTAWYTPEIPVSHGPDSYWGLPGLILEVTGMGRILLCSKVTLNPKEGLEIVPPKKGEKVSFQELEEIAIKKMKEMNEMNSRPILKP